MDEGALYFCNALGAAEWSHRDHCPQCVGKSFKETLCPLGRKLLTQWAESWRLLGPDNWKLAVI